MVVEFLSGQEEMRAFAELLRPELTVDGFESEERLVICGVSWERYLAVDKVFGDDRPGPRFYYYRRPQQARDLPSIQRAGGLVLAPAGTGNLRAPLRRCCLRTSLAEPPASGS